MHILVSYVSFMHGITLVHSVIEYQLTLHFTRWQHILTLVSDHTDRNVLICLLFLLIVTSDGLRCQLLRN